MGAGLKMGESSFYSLASAKLWLRRANYEFQVTSNVTKISRARGYSSRGLSVSFLINFKFQPLVVVMAFNPVFLFLARISAAAG
jgi:hypothetical protein